MFISPFLILMTALVEWPLQTRQMFEALYQVHRTQIALDNGAIRLGRGERAYRKWVQRVNRKLEALELLHHGVHACARVPQTMAKCRPLDLALERKLKTLVLSGKAQLRSRWWGVAGRVRGEVKRLGVVAQLRRPMRPPHRFGPCPTCHMKVRLNQTRPYPWKSVLKGEGHPFRLVVQSLENSYGIRTEEQ